VLSVLSVLSVLPVLSVWAIGLVLTDPRLERMEVLGGIDACVVAGMNLTNAYVS